MDGFSKDSYTLMCSIYFDDDDADIPVASNADSTSSRRLVAAIVDSASQDIDNVVTSVDFVRNPRPIEKSVGIIGIGGQRIPASHSCGTSGLRQHLVPVEDNRLWVHL